MKYNIQIANNGALPIAYAMRHGQEISARHLTKDTPLHVNCVLVCGTASHQLELKCIGEKAPYSLFFELNEDLIVHLPEAKA